jgi:hypothetical protein
MVIRWVLRQLYVKAKQIIFENFDELFTHLMHHFLGAKDTFLTNLKFTLV